LVIGIDPDVISLGEYSKIIVEIKPTQGAPLTIERDVPPSLDQTYISLG